MIFYFDGDVRRINHALKVYSFSKIIGELEGLNSKTMLTLELAAIFHDIGIKVSEEKYNSSSGVHQQIEGPPIARELLKKFQLEEKTIDRISFLIANHHTYSNIVGIDYRILIESDFLVNIYEDEMDKDAILNVREKYFRTKTGLEFVESLYLSQ
ncbi:HD domain-containing protein [Clostridium sp. DL1XJH146]